jgi:hypothetical protein
LCEQCDEQERCATMRRKSQQNGARDSSFLQAVLQESYL